MPKTYRKEVYIAPDILQICKKGRSLINKLLNITYIIKENDTSLRFTILSDNDNLSPQVVKWCLRQQNINYRNPTKAEKEFMSFVGEFKRIKTIFQKPFYICGKIYFADCYLPFYHCIIEVDGGYHNTDKQKLKDQKRTIYLNSYGIKVIRITNQEAIDHMKVASILYQIIHGATSDESSVSLI